MRTSTNLRDTDTPLGGHAREEAIFVTNEVFRHHKNLRVSLHDFE